MQLLDKLMKNPELITMVASALSQSPTTSVPTEMTATDDRASKAESVPSAVASDVPSTGGEATTPSPDVLAALTPLLTGLSALKKPDSKPPESTHACLLRALKPYVNPHRREAIDYMIRLSQITELLKHLS